MKPSCRGCRLRGGGVGGLERQPRAERDADDKDPDVSGGEDDDEAALKGRLFGGEWVACELTATVSVGFHMLFSAGKYGPAVGNGAEGKEPLIPIACET